MAYIGANPQISLQEYLTIDDISGSFNGTLTSFALLVGGVAPVPGPKQSNQLLISLNGVIQEPDDTGSAGFRLSGGNIIFSSAPASSTPFFGVVLAGADYVYAGTNFPDGSVTSPSITFANDLDSGFYRTGSGELAYTSNGTFRLKIDSSGRLGLGTSSPTRTLDVVGNANFSGGWTAQQEAYVQGSNATTNRYLNFVDAGTSDYRATLRRDAWFLGDTLTDIGNATPTGAKIVLNMNGGASFTGNVGIGTTSPGSNLHVEASATSSVSIVAGDTTSNSNLQFGDQGQINVGLISYNHTDNALSFRTNGSGEDMRIDSSGRLLVGAISAIDSTPLLQTANTSGGRLALGRNENAPGVGNTIGAIETYGNAGGTYDLVGGLYVDCDASHTSTSKPTNLSFHTTASSATSPTERMRINSSGNVGIGTISPTTTLSVKGASIGTGIDITHVDGGGGAQVWKLLSGIAGINHAYFALNQNTTNRITVSNAGLVGIGTNNPGSNVEIAQSNAGGSVTLRISNTGDSNIDTACTIRAQQGVRQGGEIDFGRENANAWNASAASANGYISFRPVLSGSNVEAMRITSTQSVRIGQFGSSQPAADNVRGCAIDATGFISANNTGARAIEIGRTENDAVSREVLRWFRNGSLVQTITTTATTVSYPTGSDYRLKENVVDMTGAIDRVKQLSPKRFNFIVEPGVEKDGFIAHELETVVPQAVVGEKDQVDEDGKPVWQGVDHSFLVPLLTGALQEAIAKIEILEQRLSDAGIA